MILPAFLSILFVAIFAPAEAGRYKMKRNMEAQQVMPDMIDTVPANVLHIKYGHDAKVHMGNELTPTKVQNLPIELSWHTEPHSLYTLIMADLDPPSRADPKDREVLHWLVVNIPGTDVAKGETNTEYIGSGPPKGTGLHRYVTLIFKQPEKLTLTRAKTSKTSPDGRFGFKTRDFVKENNLSGPVAGNFYVAQYDDYVPILHAQLGAGNAQQ